MNPEQEPIENKKYEEPITFKQAIDQMPEDKAKRAREIQDKIQDLVDKRYGELTQNYHNFQQDLLAKVSPDPSILDHKKKDDLRRNCLSRALSLSGETPEDYITNWPLDIVVEEDGTIRDARLDETGVYENFINEQIVKLEQEPKE